jgi:hypothetical protein
MSKAPIDPYNFFETTYLSIGSLDLHLTDKAGVLSIVGSDLNRQTGEIKLFCQFRSRIDGRVENLTFSSTLSLPGDSY